MVEQQVRGPVMMRDPTFNQGDKVTPVYTSGYFLMEGKVYEVVKFEEPFPEDFFTWPAYVEIYDDRGKLAVAHARRFKLV